MKANTPIRRLVASLLTTAMLLPALPPAQAEDSGSVNSIATNALSGLTSALNSANSFATSFGASNVQLQALAAKLAGVQALQGTLQGQQTAFNQAQILLQQALTEAQSCMSRATKDYNGKYPKAKNVSPAILLARPVDCKTYGQILDSVGKIGEQMQDMNTKMACLQNLQNNVGQIAQRAKVPFQQLVNASNEVWQTQDQMITIHDNIVEKINKDLGDKDSGYRKQLADLKELNIKLNSTLNGAPGQGKEGGMPTGFAKAVEKLKSDRRQIANTWYYRIMQDTQNCFYSDSTKECFNGMALSPAQCLQAYITNSGKYDSSTSARNGTNQSRLSQVFNLNYGKVNSNEFPASLDTKQPAVFLDYASKRFNTILSTTQKTLLSQQFVGKVDKKVMSAFVAQKYRECYDSATTRFKADIETGLGEYTNSAKTVTDGEAALANDIKTTIDLVQGQMSAFRTSFNKVYDSQLTQFTNDCTASESPYESLDCLRVLKAMISSGISGTAQTYKMSDGSMRTIDSGLTNLTVQTLSMDAQNKPTTGTASIQCKGFDDCINFLERSADSHSSAKQQLQQEQNKFVQNNNKAMEAAMDTMSGMFSQISQVIAAGINGPGGLNESMTKLGMQGTIKTKQAEGESLETDEKTKLYKMPKDMKAAMAGRNAYTEIDDDSARALTDSYNEMARKLNEKAKAAGDLKYKCKINKKEYEALATMYPSCTDTKSVCTDNAQSAVSQMSAIFRKAQSVPPEDYNNISSTISAYQSCQNEIINRRVSEVDISGGAAMTFSKAEEADAYNRRRRMDVAEARNAGLMEGQARCADGLLSPLYSEAGMGRTDTLQSQNTGLINGYKAILNACAQKDDSKVESACESFKSLAKKAEPPTGEEETKVDDPAGNTEGLATNPLLQPGTPTTIDAK